MGVIDKPESRVEEIGFLLSRVFCKNIRQEYKPYKMYNDNKEDNIETSETIYNGFNESV